MRLRILTTAASLISLSLPAYATVAASPGLTAALLLYAGATPRDIGAEAALLRSLMVERHALIQRLVVADAQRGRLLTLATLGAAEAILSGDAAALRRAIRTASQTALRRRSAAHVVLWLTPAAPGALWSPSAQALAPGPLAWAPPATTASPAPLREPLALPLALSPAELILSPAELVLSPTALAVWPAVPRLRATTPPPSAQPPAAVSSYLLPLAAPAPSVREPAALSAHRQDASLGNPLFGAPAHGRLVVDAGDGVVPIAAANAAVAAAERVPAVAPRSRGSRVRHTRDAMPRPERQPNLAALRRRWRAVAMALDQVRALEAWAQATAPTPLMTPNDLIPSPDVLHRRLDVWTAFPRVAGNPLTGSTRSAASLGRMQYAPTPGRSTDVAPAATHVPLPLATAMKSSAAALWRWEHIGRTPVPSMAAPSPGRVRYAPHDEGGLRTPNVVHTPAAAARPSTTAPTAARITAPAVARGATLALTVGDAAAGVAISGTLAARGRAGVSVSSIADTAATNLAASELAVPVALSSLPAPSVTATVVAPESSALTVATPAQTGAGKVAASPDASPTAQSTLAPQSYSTTPQSSSTSTPSNGQSYSQSGTAVPGATVLVSATAPWPVGAAAPTGQAPITAPLSLDLAVEGATPALTITTALSATPPLTLVVTLPATAAQVLAPSGFLSQREALESVLRQGEALYARMQAGEAAAEQIYRAQLYQVANLNTIVENRWYARYQAYLTYQHGFPAYERRVAAFNAYAHRLHLARLRQEQWRKRLAAWTRYAQDMAAYKVALAARRRAPISPISGTTPLPPKPVMPPFPGPEPAPFTKPPPPWPGSPPVYAANPGPEPAGYPLPLPPEAVPPWDGVAVPITVPSYGGLALGVGAAGREETTQDALLAGGALDGIGSYRDPIKGIITTYWGGRTIFQSFHPGVDIAAPMYTPIHAAAAGRVTWAGYAAPGQRHYSYGLCVIIQHNAHFSTLYAHMDDERYGLQVRVGDIVQQGQVIGYVGMTGWTTGPHLHFEIRQDNVQVNPLLLIPNPQD